MPRVSRGPHLYPKDRGSKNDGEAVWYIRDGKRRRSTGCPLSDPEGARKALQAYIGETAQPTFGDGDPSRVSVPAVISLYNTDKVPGLAKPEEARQRFATLTEFFGLMKVVDITPSSCGAYRRWRTHEGKPGAGEPSRRPRAVVASSVRRELADLQSALNYAWKSRKLMVPIPVALPDAAEPRDVWLTRGEAARLLMGALGWLMVPASDLRTRREIWRPWRRMIHRWPGDVNWHLARFVILGLRTGTRHDAICSLGWMPHVGGGYVDMEQGMLYRRAPGSAETNKRRRPAALSKRLMTQLRRWRAMDGCGLYIVSWKSKKVERVKRSFATAVRLAGLPDTVTPHVLKHSSISWAVQRGVKLQKIADYYSTSAAMIERVYGHLIPGRHDDIHEALR